MKAHFKLSIILTIIIQSCKPTKEIINISLEDVHFAIFPHITIQGKEYYLVYQIDTTIKRDQYKLVIGAKIINDTAYYYFTGRTSFKELGNKKTILINEKSLIYPYVKNNFTFWLNSNKSIWKINVK